MGAFTTEVEAEKLLARLEAEGWFAPADRSHPSPPTDRGWGVGQMSAGDIVEFRFPTASAGKK